MVIWPIPVTQSGGEKVRLNSLLVIELKYQLPPTHRVFKRSDSFCSKQPIFNWGQSHTGLSAIVVLFQILPPEISDQIFRQFFDGIFLIEFYETIPTSAIENQGHKWKMLAKMLTNACKSQSCRYLFETGVAERKNERKIILQMKHFTTFGMEMHKNQVHSERYPCYPSNYVQLCLGTFLYVLF